MHTVAVDPTQLPSLNQGTFDPPLLINKNNGRLLISASDESELEPWQFSASITTTTGAVAAQAAGAAGIRNYVASLQYQNTSSTATTLSLLDGSTVIAEFNAPANMALPAVVPFSSPLRGSAAAALNYQFGAAGATVLLNIQGYQAA